MVLYFNHSFWILLVSTSFFGSHFTTGESMSTKFCVGQLYSKRQYTYIYIYKFKKDPTYVSGTSLYISVLNVTLGLLYKHIENISKCAIEIYREVPEILIESY